MHDSFSLGLGVFRGVHGLGVFRGVLRGVLRVVRVLHAFVSSEAVLVFQRRSWT